MNNKRMMKQVHILKELETIHQQLQDEIVDEVREMCKSCAHKKECWNHDFSALVLLDNGDCLCREI